MTEGTRKLWDILEDAHVCMLVDSFQAGLRARPMGIQLDDSKSAIWFFTDADSGKVDEVARNPEVCLSVQDGTTYASVTGKAEIVDDRAKMKELWGVAADAWYPDGPETPGLTLLKVIPEIGEYWDGPSMLVAGVKMLAASVTDERPDMGENRKVRFVA